MKLILMMALLSASVFSQTEIVIYGYSKAKNQTGEITVYDELFERFNQTVGIQENIIVRYEQRRSEIADAFNNGTVLPADLVQIPDASEIGKAVAHGMLASTVSPILRNRIPRHLRDEDGKWYGITKRYRVIYTNTNFISTSYNTTFLSLAIPRFQDKVCLRNAEKTYSLTYMASLIQEFGFLRTNEFVRAIMENNPIIKTSDMSGVINSIQNGECVIGLANTYYLGHYLEDLDGSVNNQNGSSFIRPSFTDTLTRGTHVNIKAFGVLSYSSKKQAALKVIEWLSTPEAQKVITWDTHEMPVNDNTEYSAFHKYISSFGPIVENTDFDLEQTSSLIDQALEIMNGHGWN